MASTPPSPNIHNSPPESPAALRTPTRLSYRRDAPSAIPNRRPLQSPYLRRRQAQLAEEAEEAQVEIEYDDDEPPLEPRRLIAQDPLWSPRSALRAHLWRVRMSTRD